MKKYKRVMELKKLIPYEFDPRYLEADRVSFHDVQILEKKKRFGKPRRTIFVRKLILLNTDDDKEENTILINKAVIDPSISRDSLTYKMGRYLFKNTAEKYNKDIESITDELSKIKMFDFPKPKPKAPPSSSSSSSSSSSISSNANQPTSSAPNATQSGNITKEEQAQNHLDSALKKLKNVSLPHIGDSIPLQGVDMEMKSFDEEIDKELGQLQNISDNKAIYRVASKFEDMNKEMQEMAKLWQVHHPEAEKAKKKFQLKMDEMEKSMEVLGKQMMQVDKQQQEFAKRMREHQQQLNALLDVHKDRMIKLIDFNKKALQEVDSLNEELKDVDKEQEKLAKVLEEKKKKKRDVEGLQEIDGVKRGRHPFPKKVIENQKKMIDAEAQLALMNKQFEELDKSQKRVKNKLDIAKLKKLLVKEKNSRKAAGIKKRITRLKMESGVDGNTLHEPVNLTSEKKYLKHKSFDLMKMINSIISNKIPDPSEIKEPTLPPIRIRSLRKEKEKFRMQRMKKYGNPKSMKKLGGGFTIQLAPRKQEIVKKTPIVAQKVVNAVKKEAKIEPKKPVKAEAKTPKVISIPQKQAHKPEIKQASTIEGKKKQAIDRQNEIMNLNNNKLDQLSKLMNSLKFDIPKKISKGSKK